MNRISLTLIIHTATMTMMMGVAITAVLVAGLTGWKPVAIAAMAGFVLSAPLSWWASHRFLRATRTG